MANRVLIVSLVMSVMLVFLYSVSEREQKVEKIALRRGVFQQVYKDRNEVLEANVQKRVQQEVIKERIELGREETQGSGVYSTVRHLKPFGLAAFLFVELGAYRGGANSFSIVGLASKPLHVYGKPSFQCEWIPSENSTSNITRVEATKYLPDWGFGRMYTVVVLSCKFEQEIGTDVLGGQLILHATQGKGVGIEMPATFLALEEKAGDYKAEDFQPPYPYDYLYCGSSLYGDMSPQRMREWMAYHAKFFGPRSHFVFHDAGGVHPDVQKVLDPWVKAGRVTIQNFREQEKYDGYYYNQFLIVNDCMLRYKFMANWTFFFDVDEYVYVPPDTTLENVLAEYENYTQVMFEQAPMASNICLKEDENKTASSSQWGFEKLVFRDMSKGFRNRKYAMRAAKAETAGVHLSEHIAGEKIYTKGFKLRYYHYHGTITNRKEPCTEYVSLNKNNTRIMHKKNPYVFDDSMRAIAASIKEYEVQQIGEQPVVL